MVENFEDADLDSLLYHAIRAVKSTIPADGEYVVVLMC